MADEGDKAAGLATILCVHPALRLHQESLLVSGLDVHEYKNNNILYLNPIIENEFVLCQESLFAFAADQKLAILSNHLL